MFDVLYTWDWWVWVSVNENAELKFLRENVLVKVAHINF